VSRHDKVLENRLAVQASGEISERHSPASSYGRSPRRMSAKKNCSENQESKKITLLIILIIKMINYVFNVSIKVCEMLELMQKRAIYRACEDAQLVTMG
jgi:hypothetical protein